MRHSLGRATVLTVAITLLAVPVWSQGARNFDARISENAGVDQGPTQAQAAAVNRLKQDIPGLLVRFDRTTGATRALTNPVGHLTAGAPGQDHREIALGFVEQHLDALGLDAEDLAGYEITDTVPSKLTGTSHFYLRQTFEGIPVYNGQLQVHVSGSGEVTGVNNAFLPGLRGSVNTLRAARGAEQAVAAAARDLGIDLKGTPRVLARRDGAQQLTVIDGSGISREGVVARLFWLPINRGTARLVWNFQIATLDSQHHYDINVDAVSGKIWSRFDWTNSGSYRVYEQPVESPNHTSPAPPSDARTLAVNPENATASPNGWFSGGTMAGNNVHACLDASPNNVCDTPEPLCSGTTCDFSINLSGQPSTYTSAAISNLFYWNNTIHDVQYQYGFDEVGGNFQENNFGKGGAGSDSVNADAQDGSGTCNANFSTPTDGGNPRMQMFVCGNTTPSRDGDLDNGVIVHEYGHGISIRQVGGPANSSCLNNTQQAGEGWSDWHALVYTARPTDTGPQARGVGSYLFGLNPNGGTIRDLPYSTDNAVNNWTYQSIAGASVPHGVGSRWAQAAWEVYWALVDKWGFEADLLNFNISDPNEAGNKRALFYINEGLKNTACSPTFVDNRDGIIQAATNSFGGVDVCTIWEAFAAFGLGTDAISGGSNSTNPTNGFSIPAACQCSPSPIANAGPDQTICLGDSTTVGTPAQAGHTYSWAPGGQTTAQITVSPTVTTTYTVTATTSCGSASDSATVTVDDGSTPAGLNEDFEGSVAGWTASGLWHLTTDSGCATPGYSSPLHAFYYGQDATCNYDTGATNSGTLTSPSIGGLTSTSTLTFDYFRVVESFSGDFDRTRVEIVTATGATTVFSLNSSNPSTAAWVSSGPINLSAFAGQTIQVRFVFETVDNVSNNFTGWLVDDVVVTGTSQCAPPPTGCTSNAECNDGLFCNGSETCDIPTGTCQAGTPVNCNDGVGCTVDSCNETTDSCDNTPSDAACDNGLFCDGAETCNPVLDCQQGTPVDCNDGVGCTVDSCNETTDSCDNAPSDAACDNGLFCDGTETCDPVLDCQPGTNPCSAGQTCNETTDTCEGGTGCLHDVDFETGAGGWTNGASTCTTGFFVVGTPNQIIDTGVTTQVAGGAGGSANALFTQPNSSAGVDDVDGGTCEALSPSVNATGQAAVSVSLDYFHGQRDAGDDASDGFVIDVLNNGVVVDSLVSIGDVTSNAAWTSASTVVNNPGTLQLRVRATDGAATGDLVEGGVDNVQICPTTPKTCTVNDDFEAGAPDWVNDAASTCSTGAYVTGNPTNPGGGQQIVGSHSGVTSIFTAVNTAAGTDDVDGGNCILGSPSTPWSVTDPSTLSVWYWHGQRDNADDPAGDFFRLEYSTNGGSTWNTLASNGDTPSTAVWTEATALIPAGSQVKLRMQCSDGAAAGDLVECGLDDFSICDN